MFTGIIRDIGRVASRRRRGAGLRLSVAGRSLRGVRGGESIAVGGVCLTAVGSARTGGCGPTRGAVVAFDVVAETLARTTLGAARRGEPVNLERALRLGDPVGGHVVTGHVDGAGSVRAIRDLGAGGREVAFTAPSSVAAALVRKGSVAVDGVSLTVASAGRSGFRVALIPETLRRTTLGRLAPGDRVNIERDHGATVEPPERVTWALLRRAGYRLRV